MRFLGLKLNQVTFLLVACLINYLAKAELVKRQEGACQRTQVAILSVVLTLTHTYEADDAMKRSRHCWNHSCC